MYRDLQLECFQTGDTYRLRPSPSGDWLFDGMRVDLLNVTGVGEVRWAVSPRPNGPLEDDILSKASAAVEDFSLVAYSPEALEAEALSTRQVTERLEVLRAELAALEVCRDSWSPLQAGRYKGCRSEIGSLERWTRRFDAWRTL